MGGNACWMPDITSTKFLYSTLEIPIEFLKQNDCFY